MKNSLPCYGLHPELTPFIGNNYSPSTLKSAFLGGDSLFASHKVGQECYERSTANYGFGQPRYNSVW